MHDSYKKFLLLKSEYIQPCGIAPDLLTFGNLGGN